MSEALKVREYVVTLGDKVFNQRVELHESGAFAYGNRTAVHYYDGLNVRPQLFDTRYEMGITENFDSWADEFIKNMCSPKCKISAVLR